MGKRELLSSTMIPKSEKWFRFRGMCFGRRYGGQDERIVVMAPSVRELRERLARELAEKTLEITYSYVDRILVHLYEGRPVESGIVRRSALNAATFLKEVQSSDIYKGILARKIKETNNG